MESAADNSRIYGLACFHEIIVSATQRIYRVHASAVTVLTSQSVQRLPAAIFMAIYALQTKFTHRQLINMEIETAD